jgi:hypothetical protein
VVFAFIGGRIVGVSADGSEEGDLPLVEEGDWDRLLLFPDFVGVWPGVAFPLVGVEEALPRRDVGEDLPEVVCCEEGYLPLVEEGDRDPLLLFPGEAEGSCPGDSLLPVGDAAPRRDEDAFTCGALTKNASIIMRKGIIKLESIVLPLREQNRLSSEPAYPF